MIDLNKNIDDLILKYRIDSCNPMYINQIKARDIIRINFKNMVESNKKILLVSNSKSDLEEFEKTIKYYIRFDIMNHLLIDHDLHDISKKIEVLNNYEIALVISFNRHSEVCYEVKKLNKKVKIIDLYDIFLKENLYLNCEYFKLGHYIHDSYKDIFYNKQKYYNSSENKCKEHYLKLLILEHILIRDFINSKKWIDEYIKYDYTDSANYIKFWKEIEIYIYQIKVQIVNRSQRDIIIEWIDALEWDDVQEMPFLKEKMENQLCIPNAGNVTPWTNPTFYTMLLKKKAIDDHIFELRKNNIGVDDSKFLKQLIKKGYNFVYIGGNASINFKPECVTQYFGKWSHTITINQWMLLEYLFNNNSSPCVIMVHNIMETHFPYISPNLDNVYPNYDKHKRTANPSEKNKDLVTMSNKYADRQLRYYMDFIGSDTVKVFMSDHGKGELFNRWRCVMIAEGSNIKKGVYDDMFSLIDFDKFITYLINPSNENFMNIFKEYIEIQDTDIYGWSYEQLSANPISIDHLLGYRGICTKNEMLIKRNDGKRFLYKFPSKVNVISNINNAECLTRLENLIGSYQIDVNKYDYFEKSKLVRKAIDYYYKRTNGTQKIIKEILIKLAKSIPSDKIVAIRGGGEHTEKLLEVIKNYVNIYYIVDKKLEQIYQGDVYKYIKPEDMKYNKIDVVIISSYGHRIDMCKELLLTGMDYDIVDIYEYFEKNNIILRQPFYGAEKVEPIDFKNAYKDLL